MENTFRIICAFCIIFLQFPLYYLAPVGDHGSYSDVIINDTNLCNNSIKQFLYKSEFTKDCRELKYPQDIDKLTLKKNNEEQFLCLGMHDTIYKICQYTNNKKWTNTYNKKEDLDLSIQKLTGFKPNGERLFQNLTTSSKDFCKNLSGFTPMYNKTRSALSKLATSLMNPDKCLSVCFDLDDTLVPLCALLAWINQIDQTVQNKTVVMISTEPNHTNTVSNIKLNNLLPSEVTEVNTNHDNQSPNIDNSNRSPSSNKFANNDNEQIQEQLTQSERTKTELTQSPKLSTNKTAPQTNASSSVKLPKNLNSESPASSISQVPRSNTNTNSTAHSPQLQQHNEKVAKTDKNVKKETTSSPSEEVKSTTLSENTQDNTGEDAAANNQNPDDFNRMDEDPFPNNLIDNLSQPIDADNQDKNILETPGQRELGNSHIIRSDEESHFFTYFAIISLSFIVGYIGYHNKQKILAIVLEGRRSKSGRGRRRPSTANYRKLDCTLEEAVTSQCNANVTHVIY